MALDALEKEQLRKKMALRMGSFLESSDTATCVSAHYYWDARVCELCDAAHAEEVFVIKNRAGKKLHVASSCLREMVRFRVVNEVEELSKWMLRMPELRLEATRRREEEMKQRAEERKRLERKVIVRKKTSQEVN